MRYPLFGLGQQGKSANVTAQTRINLYAEISQPQEDKVAVAYYPTPGTALLLDLGVTPIRGAWAVGVSDNYYIVHKSTFYQVNNIGAVTAKGTLLTSSGRVVMSDNGRQILLVDGVAGYIYDIQADTFAQIASPDFPNGSTSCTFLGGRFVVAAPHSTTTPGRFYWSAIYDGLTWNALWFATAEATPDALNAVFADHGQLMLLGDLSVEFWGVTTNPDQPFALLGGAVSEYGIAAPNSLVKFADTTAFLARNRLASVQVCMFNGYQAVPISTPDVESLINAYPVKENATAYAYRVGGNSFYQLNFPLPGVSWLYCLNSNSWSQVQSNGGRHVGEIGINYGNQTRVTDYQVGRMYTLDPSVYTDNGAQIRRVMRSRHAFDQNFWSVGEAWIEMEMGTGLANGQGSNPQLFLRTSKDGGHSWSNEIWAGYGRIGEYTRRATFRRLGRARDWVFEAATADPVKTVFTGAYMDARQ